MNIKENAVIAFTFTETDPKDYQYFYNKLKDLSKEEAAYYLEVVNRINQKIMEAV